MFTIFRKIVEAIKRRRQMSAADVDATLERIAKERGAESNWRESIVDLMKLLDLDSSLEARNALAAELGYTGQLDGSAEMNVWLIEKVREKFARGEFED